MIIVGITGSIGTGKSTISQFFVDDGIPLLCADQSARRHTEPHSQALLTIRAAFGPQFFNSKGELLRDKLATHVFNNDVEIQKLNAIIHPLVRKDIQNFIDENKKQNKEIVAIDIPLLFEAKMEDLMTAIIVVLADQKTQVERIISRSNLTADEALARIRAQMPLSEKAVRGHYIIDNSKSIENSRLQYHEILKKLKIKN